VATAIEQFTRALLAHCGALVEADGEDLAAVIPTALGSALGVAEYQRLAFVPGDHRSDALLVDYDSPLLDRMGRLVETMAWVAWLACSALPWNRP